MIEILPEEIFYIVIGIVIGVGCPACAKAILGFLSDGKCEDCPDYDCKLCPEEGDD